MTDADQTHDPAGDETGVASDDTAGLVGEPHAVPGEPPDDVTGQDDTESDPADQPQDEQGDEQGDHDGDAEPHGTPEATVRAMSEREIERVNRKLESEARRHATNVLNIMGDDANVLEQCPLCLPLIPGFRYPYPPQAEQLAAVKEAIGEPADPPLLNDAYSSLCVACAGWGAVATGSKVVGKNKVRCLDCNGLGYVPIDTRREGVSLLGNGADPIVPQFNQPLPDAPLPPEVEALRALGYIVVEPPQPIAV